MTQGSDWSNDPRIVELSERLERAVSSSFAFLEQIGFRRCPPSNVDMGDLRDARVNHQFVRAEKAVHVNLSYLTFQIEVVLLSLASPATCDPTEIAR
jgi:hypothetical protein